MSKSTQLEGFFTFQLEQSPAIILLRSEHANFIVSFFQLVFSQTQRFQISYQELVATLDSYNQGHHQPLPRRASEYIERWADENHRFLRKYYVEGHDEPQVELSYEVSSMISWLDSQRNQAFVGTESRVSSLFQMIDKLARHSDTDPKARLAKLKEDREAIDQEMQQIKKTGTVVGWDELRKREYLSQIMEDARRLLADFALIEDIFKDHARQLKESMLSTTLSKGDLLAQVLDMHDALEESDQGKSFRAFWNFLISPTKQEELTQCLSKILQDLAEKPYLKGMQQREYIARLKGLKGDLLNRGRKVLASQNRLTREIRTLLVQNATQDAKAMQAAIAEIKRCWIEHKPLLTTKATETLIHIEYKPFVHLPLERPLWSEPSATQLNFGTPLTADTSSWVDIEDSASISAWQLETRLDELLTHHPSLTLTELLTLHPAEQLLEELIAYISIGIKHNQHQVDRHHPISIDEFIMPQVTFHRKEAP